MEKHRRRDDSIGEGRSVALSALRNRKPAQKQGNLHAGHLVADQGAFGATVTPVLPVGTAVTVAAGAADAVRAADGPHFAM